MLESYAIKMDRESNRLHWISKTPSPAPPVFEEEQDEVHEPEPEDLLPQLMSDMEVEHTFPSPREHAVMASVP